MGGANTNNGQTGNQKLYGIATNSSVLGQNLTVVLGTQKVNQLIFWQDGFQANPLSKKQAGGKGGGKSGQYNYSADVIAGLCSGPVSGIGNIWTGQSFLTKTNAAEQFAITSTNFTFTPANASAAVNNFGVTPSANFSATFNDFSAPSPTEVSATTSTPFTQVPLGTNPNSGEYTYNPSTGVYTFSPEDNGKTVTAAYSFLLTTITQQTTAIIPSNLTIDVSPEFPFNADLGVVFSSTTAADDGEALQKVNGTPSQQGTYSQSGSGPAVYRFAPADQGAQITITFQINNTGAVSAGESNTLDFTLATGEIGQEPYSFLTSSFPDAALGYSGCATVLYEPMDLGPSAEIQQNSFEVVTPDIFGGVYATTNLPILDCNPVQVILRILTDTQWGLGVGAIPFPQSVIDNGPGGTWGTPGTPSVQQTGSTAYNWFAANSFFISALLDSQDSASSTIGKFLEAGMCAAYVSEGLLKLVSWGDTTQAGNGCTWTAPTNAVVALDDTSFICKEGDDPVQIERSPWMDSWNGISINFTNRSNQYNTENLEEIDGALQATYGERLEDAQDYPFICELPAAQFAANMRLKHLTQLRNTYKFSLPFFYSFLEPMDVITLSTSSTWAQELNNENLGIVNLPVRVTKVVDNPGEDGLQIECTDYPFGVGAPTLFNKGLNSSTPVQNTQANPGTAEVVFFEASGRLVQFGPNEIWLGACGTSSNYGGCNVFASTDNETFIEVANLKQAAVIGELAAALPVGSDPDTVNSLVVELAENSAGLVSATQNDANLNTTLCFVDGEYISFSEAAVTGDNTWTLGTYLRRGQLGSPISAHAVGGLFMRLDGSIGKYAYDPTWNGIETFWKFQPYNSFGNQATPLSQLQSVSLTLSATNSSVIDGSSGLIEQGSVDGLTGTLTGINTTIAGLTASTTANLTVLADMSSVSFLTPSEQIAFMAQFTAMLSTQTSLDATAHSLSISTTTYDAAVANISTQLIAAGAPSNFASTWPTMTTFGPATDIQTDLANLFAEVASQQAALQSEISAQQASRAQAAAVATAASNALTQINTAVNVLNEQAPTVVTTLPTLPSSSFPPGKYIFDATNNELVVVNAAGTGFTSLTVPAANIAGTLSAAQVASLAASQITGQLTASQIASIAAAQVSGQLTASQISSVSASTVTGGLTASQIASVAAASLTGTVGSGNMCANGDFVFFGNANEPGSSGNTVVPQNFNIYNNGSTPVTSIVTTGGAIGIANLFAITANAAINGNTFGFIVGTEAATGGLLAQNTNYVISFYAAAFANAAGAPLVPGSNLSAAWNQPPVTQTFLMNPGLTTSFQRYAILVNWGNNPVDPNAFFTLATEVAPAGTILHFSNVQIQQGDALTGWAPPAVSAANPISPATVASFIAAGSIQAGQLAANSVTAAAIEAGTITATQIASSTLTSANIVAGSIVGSSIAAGTIASNNIEAGAITTSLLAADSVTTANLVVSGVGSALNPDPNCSDITAFAATVGGSISIVPVTDNAAGQVGATALQFVEPVNGDTDIRVTTGPIPISFGKSYRVSILVRNVSGAGTDFFVRCFQFPGSIPQQNSSPAGAITFELGLESLTVPTAWTRYEATFSPASGATWCVLEVEADFSTTEAFQIQDWRLEEQVPGSLIVNGAITATQIAASTITGGNIAAQTITGANLVANTITAGQLAANSVTAAAIEAGTITSAQIAAGTIQASNIASATITGGQIAGNTITGNNIQAGTITGNNIQAGTITAGQIAAGAIGATQIAADSISTSNLTVGDLTNNVYNPGFEAGLTSWVSQSAAVAISTAQAHSGTQSLELTPVSGAFALINANIVPAVPGQQFISQIFAMATSGTSGSVNLRMYWYTASEAQGPGGSPNAIDAAPFPITTSWVQQTANFTVPANAVAVQFGIVSTNIAGGDVFLDDCYFRRMTDGSLIVDGSISSAMITTGGLSADVITSGTINAADVNVTNINADNITVGTLDATQVVFSDGSSLDTAARIVIAQSTISSAVSVISTDPVETGLGFTVTIEQATDVVNLWATLAIFPFVSIVVFVIEDDTVISQTTLAESQNVFFFSMNNIGAGAHEFRLAVALATTQTSGIQPVLNPTSSGTYMIGQLLF